MAHVLKKNCSYNIISVHLIKLHFHIIKIYNLTTVHEKKLKLDL